MLRQLARVAPFHFSEAKAETLFFSPQIMALLWEGALSSLGALCLAPAGNAEDESLRFPFSFSAVSPENSLVAGEAVG